MRNTLESYKVSFAEKLKQDNSGKGIIIRNSDGTYIAHLSNERIATASRLKELAEKIERFSNLPIICVPNYS